MNDLGGVIITLKDLFDNYMEFEEILKSARDGEIDLTDVELNPTTSLPLLCEFKKQNFNIPNKGNAFEVLEGMLK